MTSVSDYAKCKQCGFESAYYDLDCDSGEWEVQCGCCGYYAAAKRHVDGDGKVTWTHPEDCGERHEDSAGKVTWAYSEKRGDERHVDGDGKVTWTYPEKRGTINQQGGEKL
jgi:hypothetical protein